ncbi:MAG TPA: hypothetical protein VIV66_07245 [Pyrinomonadaceae bacterium]
MKKKGRFIFYHRTSAENARAIVDSGFTNSSGYFLSNRIWTGVWLSSIPVDSKSAAQEEALLLVKLELGERELSRWEWFGEGRSYREWLVPAGIINRCAKVEMVDQLDASTVAA